MRTGWLAILMVGAVPLGAESGGDAGVAGVPSAHPAARYDGMKGQSPFVLATPTVAPETPSFAQNLFIGGMAQIGDRFLVTVTSPDKKSFSLLTGEQGPDGVALVSVERSDEVGKSKATIRKGSEFAVIKFNEMAVKTPIQVAAAQPGQPPVTAPPPQVQPGQAPPAPQNQLNVIQRRRLIRQPR